MIPRPPRIVAVVLPLLLIAATDAAAICPEPCYPSVPAGVSWYGGTSWDGVDARWEAVPGSTWTFDSGVGSSILGSDTGNKKAGLHGEMEGWTGVLAGGTWDWSNLRSINDLPPPLTTCTCNLQDSVLVFEDLIGGSGHEDDQDNWAASPWIDLQGGDLGKSGRIVTADLYHELPLLNYVALRVTAQWRVGPTLSSWTHLASLATTLVPQCTQPGSPAVFDLSAVIPSTADEVSIGLGVVNFCWFYPGNCTYAANYTPVYDNVRFGVYDPGVADFDNDGVTDAVENGAPNSGDADYDVTADSQQASVASLLDYAGTDYVTLSIPAPPHYLAGGFRCVQTVAASSLPPAPGGTAFPCDLFEYTVVGASDVTMRVPVQCLTGRYFVYGQTPGDPTDHWYAFDWDGTTGARVVDGAVTLTFVDGMRGDGDLTANGVIVHLGGPAMVAGLPHAGNSTVPNVLYEPGGLLTYQVLVRDDADNPVNGALVQIVTPPAISLILCNCNFLNPLTDITDANGVATFQIQAGGCIDPDSVGAYFEVTADSIYLASVGGVSPDAVDDNGKLPWQGWAAGSCQTSLADAVFHYPKISVRAFNFCTDLDSDNRISIVDGILMTDSILMGSGCSP